MKMMTKEIERMLPKLYVNDGKPKNEVKVVVKYFDPCGSATWYITEYDGQDTMYGYVTGLQEDEYGYVSYKELCETKTRFGLGIERDLNWNPNTTLAEAIDKKL